MEGYPSLVPFQFGKLQGGVTCKRTKLDLIPEVWNSLVNAKIAEGKELKQTSTNDFKLAAQGDLQLRATKAWKWGTLHVKGQRNKKKISQAAFDFYKRAANALDKLEGIAKLTLQRIVQDNYDKETDTLDWDEVKRASANFASLAHDEIGDNLQPKEAFKATQDN